VVVIKTADEFNPDIDPNYWPEIVSQRILDSIAGGYITDTLIGRTPRYRMTPAQLKAPHVANFRDALIAASNIWQVELSDADRSFWKAIDADRDGARPNMQGTYANGWNLFAMFSLAPLMMNPQATLPPQQREGWPADLVQFIEASSATQLLKCRVIGAVQMPAENVNLIFVHQVDPEHIGRGDQTRRTLMAGYHAFGQTPPGGEEFTVSAPYTFEAGDTVATLLREHVNTLEVKNSVQALTAT